MAGEGSDDYPEIPGLEIKNRSYAPTLWIYAQKGLWYGGLATPIASIMSGHMEARRKFPFPQHVPAQVAWQNAVRNMKGFAAPLIGTMTLFEVSRGYYETRYPMKKQFEYGPMLFATAVGALPLAISFALKKPHPMLATGVALGVYDYAWDRTWLDLPFLGNNTM